MIGLFCFALAVFEKQRSGSLPTGKRFSATGDPESLSGSADPSRNRAPPPPCSRHAHREWRPEHSAGSWDISMTAPRDFLATSRPSRKFLTPQLIADYMLGGLRQAQ